MNKEFINTPQISVDRKAENVCVDGSEGRREGTKSEINLETERKM